MLTSLAYAKTNIVVSILPQKTFVQKIAGTKAKVSAMVKPGFDPHTYEPKPSQMMEVSKADIYFPIGIEFEHVWLNKFIEQNKKMKIVDMTQGISYLKMPEHKDHHDEHEKEHKEDAKEDHKEHAEHANDKHDEHEEHKKDSHAKHEHAEGKDPHVWTSPARVKLIAKNIYNALVKVDEKNKEYYKNNYIKFLNEIANTDNKIREIFLDLPLNANFMVFHPSWQYFARDYSLTQLVIEVEGKEPKPKTLKRIIEQAKKEKVKAIFAQKEFSDKSAKTIAKQLNIQVIKETPLASNWSENLINMAKAIADSK